MGMVGNENKYFIMGGNGNVFLYYYGDGDGNKITGMGGNEKKK